MPYYGGADITRSGKLPGSHGNECHISYFNGGASPPVSDILIYSHYWWGSGALWLQCWKAGYDGRSAGYAEFQPRGVTNSAASGMSIVTIYNHNCPVPYWAGYGGTSPGRNNILKFQQQQYNTFIWKLTSIGATHMDSASSVDNNNSVHLYGGTRQWG